MNEHQGYESALATRNASQAMQAIWSPHRKFSTWRRLWLALAESQQQLGLAITDAQLDELRTAVNDIDYVSAARHEKQARHDVMAHVHAYAEAAPGAAAIIHLGATSQFVNCNTEMLQIRDGLRLVAQKLARGIDALGDFAVRYRALPSLAFTHFQPAQPTTVGKRAAMWGHDLALALEEVEHRLDSLRFRGVKGTTGTQASFLTLFDGDHDKVEQLDQLVTEKMDWPVDRRFFITGQTYPRVVDALVTSTLAAAAAVAAKFATDLRLLANRKEIEEPFESEQVGSSAMAYKRNPMRSERICGLARFVIGQTALPYTTAAEQWLERTLDDSSARRLSLPEPFLATDGLLDLLINVVTGLVVYEKTIAAHLDAEMPFMASENIMMAAVNKSGADRQQVHEIVRRHSQEAARQVKEQGKPNDLLDRLKGEKAFADLDLQAELDASKFIGRAPQQVDQFIEHIVQPIRNRYRDTLSYNPKLHV